MTGVTTVMVIIIPTIIIISAITMTHIPVIITAMDIMVTEADVIEHGMAAMNLIPKGVSKNMLNGSQKIL